MALKWHSLHTMSCPHYCYGDASSKKDPGDLMVSVELSSASSVKDRDSVVRIVLASGMVEVYAGVVPAYLVMKKYPGLCLARPEVFKRPHDSHVSPKAMLLPGQKFYLVPMSTIKKLRRKFPKIPEGGEHAEPEDKMKEHVGMGIGANGDESLCSAKDFYASNDKWSQCVVRKFLRGAEKQDEVQEKKPFVPPINKGKMRQGVMSRWKPSLETVEELSP